MDNTQEYTCLSLCSGYGGLELGLKRACPNIRTVAYVEVEAFACANLVSKMEKGLLDAAPIWTDIKTFNAKPFRDQVHIITAGYPCQPFSVAGKRQGTDDPRHLWPHIARIIEAVRPVWFFGENVSGHLALGFPEVYRSLRNMGYAVEAGLFTAAEVGAPHRRERLFVLAHNMRCPESQQQRSDNIGGRTTQRQTRNSFWFRTGSGIEPRNTAQGMRKRERNPQKLQKSNQLADTESAGTGQGIIKETQTGIGRDRFAVGSMANTKHAGPQGPGLEISAGGGEFAWPARPGQPQYEWEKPRTIMGRLNPNWVENLMGIPCNWTNPLYNGTKNKGDSYGNANQATEKELSVLRKQVRAKAIQGEVGRFQSIPEAEVLQSSLPRLRKNTNNTKQRDGEKTSISSKNEKLRGMREQKESSTPPRRLQSTTKNNNLMSKMPRRITQSKRDLGEDAKLRVDRLRLLGNGVVPQQAEKAFRYLIEKFG